MKPEYWNQMLLFIYLFAFVNFCLQNKVTEFRELKKNRLIGNLSILVDTGVFQVLIFTQSQRKVNISRDVVRVALRNLLKDYSS